MGKKIEKIENFNLKTILGLWWRQVVEWSLPTPEVRGSNPSNYIEYSPLIVSAFYGLRCISEDWVRIPLLYSPAFYFLILPNVTSLCGVQKFFICLALCLIFLEVLFLMHYLENTLFSECTIWPLDKLVGFQSSKMQFLAAVYLGDSPVWQHG